MWLRDRRGARRRRRRLPRPHAAVDLDPRDRRVLLALGGQAGPLHLSHRAGGRRAGGVVDRARDRAGVARGAPRIALVTAAIGAAAGGLRGRVPCALPRPFAVYVLAARRVGVIAMAAARRRCCSRVRRRDRRRCTVVAAALVVVNWIFVLSVLPSFEAYKPAPGLAAVLAERAAPEDLIVTYNVALPSLVYYLRRHTDVFYDHEPGARAAAVGPAAVPAADRATTTTAIDQAGVAGAAVPDRVAADIRREAAERAVAGAFAEVLLMTNRLWKPAGWCARERSRLAVAVRRRRDCREDCDRRTDD